MAPVDRAGGGRLPVARAFMARDAHDLETRPSTPPAR